MKSARHTLPLVVMVVFLFLVVILGSRSAVSDRDRIQELTVSQRIQGTNEFALGWNMALENLQHHLRGGEK